MIKLESVLLLDQCPHCKVNSPNLVRVQQFSTNNFQGSRLRALANYACQRCGGVVTASGNGNLGNPEIEEMFPSSLVLDNTIPEKAKLYLSQAIDSLHSPSGSIMLSASAIDSMLKSKGYKDGKLYSRINKAAEDNIITESMSKWAHQVRLDANDERHADDESTMPNELDAKKSIDFALALAQFLFILPSLVEKGIQDSKNI
jgi:hypothetical protein